MDQIELREILQEEVHKMRPSGWAVYGIFIIFGFVLIVLGLSYFIKYPDVIVTEARLISTNPAVTLPAKTASKIFALEKTDGSFVQKGDLLVVIKDNSNYKDVLNIKHILCSFEEDQNWLLLFEEMVELEPRLGDLVQGAYYEFMQSLLEFHRIEKLKSFDIQIGRLRDEVDIRKQICESFVKILTLNNRIDTILSERKDIDAMLYHDSLISKFQYETTNQEYMQSQKGFTQEQLSSLQSNLQLVQIENSIGELLQRKKDALLALKIKLNSSYNNLRDVIAFWEERFLIIAPIDGVACYLKPIKLHQSVSHEESLITILPDSVSYMANLKIPFSGAGKIEVGQEVHIKLNDYPYQEFGFLEGVITNISLVANEDHYNGEVLLNKGNRTNYNKEVLIKENAKGNAEVITKDRSWMGRIFEKILYVIKK